MTLQQILPQTKHTHQAPWPSFSSCVTICAIPSLSVTFMVVIESHIDEKVCEQCEVILKDGRYKLQF